MMSPHCWPRLELHADQIVKRWKPEEVTVNEATECQPLHQQCQEESMSADNHGRQLRASLEVSTASLIVTCICGSTFAPASTKHVVMLSFSGLERSPSIRMTAPDFDRPIP
jgi:hypothetical protein